MTTQEERHWERFFDTTACELYVDRFSCLQPAQPRFRLIWLIPEDVDDADDGWEPPDVEGFRRPWESPQERAVHQWWHRWIPIWIVSFWMVWLLGLVVDVFNAYVLPKARAWWRGNPLSTSSPSAF